jgi:hypothetical protein
MMMAPHPDSGLDEVTRAPERRPVLYSGAREAPRRRFKQLRSAFRIETTPAAGQLTDTLPGDAPVAVLGNAPLAAFAGAAVGCLATEHFSAFGIVPDVASALATALVCGLLLVTRTTGLFAGAFFSALYGGSFVGMTPLAWLGDSPAGALAVILAIVCGLVFLVVARLDSRSTAPIGIECGGRLGAIAVVASFLFVELVRPLGADTSRFHVVAARAFDVEPWSAIRGFLVCLAGIVGTLFLLRQRRIADGGVPLRIFIASAAALPGLIVLHFGNPDDAAATDAFYAGCFLGMSAPNRLKGWLQPVSGALVLIAVLVPVRAFLNGFGGGLGLAAFIAAMLLVAVSPATAWMTRDMTGNRSFATAIASAAIAVMVSLITAAPLAEDMPIAVAAPASEPTAELPDAAPVRLVVGKPAPGATDNPIPISISLINAAADDVVFLSGLPSGSTMTSGRASATGGWQLLARELADTAVRPAKGFVGGADITVELRNVDQSIIDRQELHLEWAGPAPQATTDVALTAGPPAAPIPDAVTEHEEAIFRAFLQSRGNATPDTPGTAHPPRAADVRITVRGPNAHGQAAASGPHLLVVPLAGGAVRPRQPMVWRADFSDRQKKPAPKGSLPASRRDRPTAPSVSP